MNRFRTWLNRCRSHSRRVATSKEPASPERHLSIGCMGIEPEDLQGQLQRIAELTPATTGLHRLLTSAETLLARSVDPHTLRHEGRYTVPRTFGVYEVPKPGLGGDRYHFGNHPVRQREIAHDYGRCRLIALFIVRQDARDLQRMLNAGH